MNLFLGGRETSLSDLVIPPELYSDNVTNTSSGTPTRFQIFNETEQQKIIEKHVRLGAVSEVRCCFRLKNKLHKSVF